MAALACGLGAGSPGCVMTVYQPLSGFHRPIVADPSLPNFTDARVHVDCFRGDALSTGEAMALCEKVRTLLQNQGAEIVRRDAAADEALPGLPQGFGMPSEATEPPAQAASAGPRTELTLELRARDTPDTAHPFSWVLFLGSFTVLPGVVESTFAQEVTIRDGSGFLLASDTLEGRLVTRYGVGPWLGNVLLNFTRPKDERLDKESANRDLSADLYGQLTQDLFNAKLHAEVLRRAPSAGATE